MSEFDPIKAVREELAGMAEVLQTIRRREQSAEAAISVAESELHSIRKLRGYAEIERSRLLAKLKELEDAAQK
jgi:hypothetical protein